jgi:hypothetical protein
MKELDEAETAEWTGQGPHGDAEGDQVALRRRQCIHADAQAVPSLTRVGTVGDVATMTGDRPKCPHPTTYCLAARAAALSERGGRRVG